MSLVLDANVIVKWYTKEPWSERAAKLKDAYVRGRVRLVEPTLALYEVGNAIHRSPQFGPREAQEGCRSVALFLRGVEEAPTPDEAAAIQALARRVGLTYYDACYVHLAQKHRIPLVTADDKVATKAAKTAKIIPLRAWRPSSTKDLSG